MKKNKYYSYNVGALPKGCQYCVKGEKMVLFITGKCPRNCYFCPVSDQKYQKDVLFANERRVKNFKDLIEEAEAMDAKGTGITGGDPLSKLERTLDFIKILKKKFGKNFHIHLYTSLNLVNIEYLRKLYEAGLDEIRFHLDLDSKKFWKKIAMAGKFNWEVGVEIPLIPNKGESLKEMIDFVNDKIDFLNLNELEVADNEQSKLLKMGMKIKNKTSYAVEKSMELGLEMLDYVKEKGYTLPVHLCTAKLKDFVQLGNRLKREAEVSRNKFDLVDEEGMLVRGALYLEELKPGFGYRRKLKELGKTDKVRLINKLKILAEQIKKKFKLEADEMFIDHKKPRILISKKLAKKKKKYFSNLNMKPAVVVEYPTADQLEIEIEFLS